MKIGFWGVLQIVFITLKLMGYITWSWWLVILPALIFVCFMIVAFIGFYSILKENER